MLLHRIRQFIAVVDAGSIRGAARQLSMSQPALTRALQQLEEELGVQLMRRGVRGASLTPAGAAFLARARVADAELRMGADEAKRSNDGGGLVTVGVSPSAATVLLPELVTTLQKRRPNTRIRLIESNPSALPSLVREAALDMAVAHARSDLDSGLHYRYLYDIQLRVVVRPGHPLAGARTFDDLVRASWLSMAAPDSPNDNIKQSFLAAGLPAPVLAVYCGSHSVALDLIAASDMIALLPAALLRSHMTAGRLVELRLTKSMMPLQVGLYTRAGSPASPAAEATAQIITAIARRLISSGELRHAEPISSQRLGGRRMPGNSKHRA